jgi:hypothetical protein
MKNQHRDANTFARLKVTPQLANVFEFFGKAGGRRKRRLPTMERLTECGGSIESDWADRRLFTWLNGYSLYSVFISLDWPNGQNNRSDDGLDGHHCPDRLKPFIPHGVKRRFAILGFV